MASSSESWAIVCIHWQITRIRPKGGRRAKLDWMNPDYNIKKNTSNRQVSKHFEPGLLVVFVLFPEAQQQLSNLKNATPKRTKSCWRRAVRRSSRVWQQSWTMCEHVRVFGTKSLAAKWTSTSAGMMFMIAQKSLGICDEPSRLTHTILADRFPRSVVKRPMKARMCLTGVTKVTWEMPARVDEEVKVDACVDSDWAKGFEGKSTSGWDDEDQRNCGSTVRGLNRRVLRAWQSPTTTLWSREIEKIIRCVYQTG